MSALAATPLLAAVASMRAWSATHRLLWWAIGLGVVARALVLLVYAPWSEPAQSALVLLDDAGVYHRLALCILESHDFCQNTNRTPGYPVFVAAVYSLFGIQPWIVLALQILVDALTIALTYAIGLWLFSPTVAAAAALLLAVDPTSLFTSSSLLTDSLFTLLFLASVALFLRGLASKSIGWALAAGLTLGITTWIRPSAQYLPILLSFAALCRFGWAWPRRLCFAFAMTAAFALTISPWLYRNQHQFGALALATVKGETLLNWQAAFFLAWRDHKPVDEIRKQLALEVRQAGWVDDGNPFVNSEVQERVALRHISVQPLAYAAAMLRGIGFMYLNVGMDKIGRKLGLTDPEAPKVNLRNAPTLWVQIQQTWNERGAAQIALAAVLAGINLSQYVLALAGCVVAWRDRRYRWVGVFFMALVAYFTVTSGISAEARYKMPVIPLYLMLAGLAVQAWLQQRQKR